MEQIITVIPGDGAGPDIINAAQAVMLAAAKKYDLPIRIERCEAGGAALDRYGTPLPDDVLDVCSESDAVLIGPVGGKKWLDRRGAADPSAVLKRLCSYLHADTSVCVIPALQRDDEADPTLLTVVGSRGYNIPRISALTGRDLTYIVPRGGIAARSHPAPIQILSMPAALMRLIRSPDDFDVIAADPDDAEVLSSAAAALSGFPTAAHIEYSGGKTEIYSPFCSLPETLHGTGLCDPSGAVFAAAMLIERSLGEINAARAIRSAVRAVLAGGMRTAPLSGGRPFASTDSFRDAIIEKI